MAKRKLITEAAVRAAVAAGQQAIPVPAQVLITPLARDLARTHGLAFVPEQAPPAPGAADEKKPACGCPPGRPKVVALGSDHGGFAYKNELAAHLAGLGWQVLDVGTTSEAPCDYPDFAYAVARAVALGQAGFGVMIDGAGIGSAMVCNKVAGIRAACAYNEFTAWNARAHNDAHVLTLGSRTLGIEVCKRILTTFLDTAFEGGRHQARVAKIDDVAKRFAG
jgi:ribose 5-phosphate isomerase B